MILSEGLQETGPETSGEGATPHYLLGATTITDPSWVADYMEKVPRISVAFGVEGLAMGNDFTVLEGDWPRDAVVLLKFPSEAVFQQFWYGDDYRPMKEAREAGTVAENISFAGVVD